MYFNLYIALEIKKEIKQGWNDRSDLVFIRKGSQNLYSHFLTVSLMW
ncbi:Uncharacterised protein [Streptococcus criceti]|nr:Uncharacterised protein [Streptococcus criceti]